MKCAYGTATVADFERMAKISAVYRRMANRTVERWLGTKYGESTLCAILIGSTAAGMADISPMRLSDMDVIFVMKDGSKEQMFYDPEVRALDSVFEGIKQDVVSEFKPDLYSIIENSALKSDVKNEVRQKLDSVPRLFHFIFTEERNCSM